MLRGTFPIYFYFYDANLLEIYVKNKEHLL